MTLDRWGQIGLKERSAVRPGNWVYLSASKVTNILNAALFIDDFSLVTTGSSKCRIHKITSDEYFRAGETQVMALCL